MALPGEWVAREAEFLDSGARLQGRDFIVTCIHGTWHFWCPRRVPPFSCPGGPKLDSEAPAALILGFYRMGSAAVFRGTVFTDYDGHPLADGPRLGFYRMGSAAVFRGTVFADSDGPPLALIARTTVFLA